MAELLGRYEQILTILSDAKSGMSNRQIMESAQKMRNNQIPNDITQMSLNTLALRRRELIRTVESPDGKLQFITTKGLSALIESLGKPLPFVFDPATASHETTAATQQPDDDPLPSGTEAYLNGIFNQIRALVADDKPTIKIADKARKLATLEQLEKFPAFTQDIADMLAAIRADIERIE